MPIKETLSKLGDLYKHTGDDWALTIHHDLTEPTCPSVAIAREGSNSTRYLVHRDTIEEGVEAAVDLVYREIVMGEVIESECPFTNPDDHK